MNYITVENEEIMNFNAYARKEELKSNRACTMMDCTVQMRESTGVLMNPNKMKRIIKAGALFPLLLKQANH